MVMRHSANGFMPISEDGRWVTHADYRALEEDARLIASANTKLAMTNALLVEELAALRGKVGELVEADLALDSCIASQVIDDKFYDRRQAALNAVL